MTNKINLTKTNIIQIRQSSIFNYLGFYILIDNIWYSRTFTRFQVFIREKFYEYGLSIMSLGYALFLLVTSLFSVLSYVDNLIEDSYDLTDYNANLYYTKYFDGKYSCYADHICKHNPTLDYNHSTEDSDHSTNIDSEYDPFEAIDSERINQLVLERDSRIEERRQVIRYRYLSLGIGVEFLREGTGHIRLYIPDGNTNGRLTVNTNDHLDFFRTGSSNYISSDNILNYNPNSPGYLPNYEESTLPRYYVDPIPGYNFETTNV